MQEYRARKKAALQRRVAAQLRSSLGQGQGRGLMSTGVDFNQLVNSFAGEACTNLEYSTSMNRANHSCSLQWEVTERAGSAYVVS